MTIDDSTHMARALQLAEAVRVSAHPNPWVGSVLVIGEHTFEGATEPDGGRHAEAVILDQAPDNLRDATLYVTLEPCWPFPGKRTGSCAQRLVQRGLRRAVVAMEDPDARVAGQGIQALRDAGVSVEVGVRGEEARQLYKPYVHHRTTGRPYVVLKLATSLDGRIAAPDGSSQWITGEEARRDAHRLRAESDAILVGAGTVRTDNPSLTTRLVEGPDPRRIVLGTASPDAAIHPCTELSGSLPEILARLGSEHVVQLLVEGGASVATQFHQAGLVDRYVVYLAPVLFGGEDARGLFVGAGAPNISDAWRGRIVRTQMFGPDIRVDVEPV
jgi:diaminohydroxyphosphoribosylaminopyrimidine deaminase / 5-amino-6-(5-phosphoribosylamino)uracil reductase